MVNHTLKALLNTGNETIRYMVMALVKDEGVSEIVLDSGKSTISIEDIKGKEAEVPTEYLQNNEDSKTAEYIKKVFISVGSKNTTVFSDWTLSIEHNKPKTIWKLTLTRNVKPQTFGSFGDPTKTRINSDFDVVDV